MCGWCKQPVPTPVGVIFKVYICLNIIVLGLITITDSIDVSISNFNQKFLIIIHSVLLETYSIFGYANNEHISKIKSKRGQRLRRSMDRGKNCKAKVVTLYYSCLE